jgi:hypothetical protein
MKTVLAACVAIFLSTAAHSEPEFDALRCEPLFLSNTIDRYLDDAWKSAHKLFGDPSLSLNAAKVRLGWYYLVCTDYNGTWFMKHDLKDFLYTAASLTDNMSAEDAANAKVYQERAVKYQIWADALDAADSKPPFLQWLWIRIARLF